MGYGTKKLKTWIPAFPRLLQNKLKKYFDLSKFLSLSIYTLEVFNPKAPANNASENAVCLRLMLHIFANIID